MILRQPALRDADKAAQPGFRRQQIVKAAVAAALVEVVADRQQIAGFVVEKRVVDLAEFAALFEQILDQLRCAWPPGCSLRRRPRGDGPARSFDPVADSIRRRHLPALDRSSGTSSMCSRATSRKLGA